MSTISHYTDLEAYNAIRSQIVWHFVASQPPGSPGETLGAGSGGCLAKATLLCSLYRAMGMPATAVRVITGNVVIADYMTDHAWLDLEYKGACLQQDPSGLLGSFGFEQFPGMEFSQAFVREEDFCFNDKGFAVVSQLNLLKNGLPEGMPPIR